MWQQIGTKSSMRRDRRTRSRTHLRSCWVFALHLRLGEAPVQLNLGTATDEPPTEVQRRMGGESNPNQIADLAAFIFSPQSVCPAGRSR